MLNQKEVMTDRQTDKLTDGRKDGQTLAFLELNSQLKNCILKSWYNSNKILCLLVSVFRLTDDIQLINYNISINVQNTETSQTSQARVWVGHSHAWSGLLVMWTGGKLYLATLEVSSSETQLLVRDFKMCQSVIKR